MTKLMTTVDTPLAELAVRIPAATKVFHRHGLDFCCKGWRSLSVACESKALDPVLILDEIKAEAREPSDLTNWSERPLGEVIDYIVTRYHKPLREELEHFLAMARKVERVHAEKPTCPRGLAEHLEVLSAEVGAHLDKEERILFPMIRAGQPAHMPVQVMVQEHDDHAANLKRTRELTNELQPPSDACTTWRALYMGLGVLERELMDHIHLENNVLFPRALRGGAEPAVRPRH